MQRIKWALNCKRDDMKEFSPPTFFAWFSYNREWCPYPQQFNSTSYMLIVVKSTSWTPISCNSKLRNGMVLSIQSQNFVCLLSLLLGNGVLTSSGCFSIKCLLAKLCQRSLLILLAQCTAGWNIAEEQTIKQKDLDSRCVLKSREFIEQTITIIILHNWDSNKLWPSGSLKCMSSTN